MRQRAVITGGAGFLGSHLAERLLDENIDVVCLDNFVTGSAGQRRAPAGPRRLRADRSWTSPTTSTCPARSTTCCTSPRRPRRSTTRSCRSRRSRPGRSARCTAWGWPARRAPGSCSPPPRRPTATRWCTRSPRPTGATSTRSARGRATTRRSASRRRSPCSYRTQHGVDTAIMRIFNTYGPRMRPERRAGDPDLRPAGAGRRADHGRRRRQPDPLGLLRRRPGRGRAPAAPLGPGRPGEHRQPARADRAGGGRAGPGDRRRATRRSSSSSAPSTIPRCAGRTSRWPAPSSAGSRRSTCATAWPGRSPGSAERPDLMVVAPRLPGLDSRTPATAAPTSFKVAVVGTGYVGAVTASCLAWLGHEVCGLDSDAIRAAQLNEGQVPFFEPGLSELLGAARATGRLQFTDEPADGAAPAPTSSSCASAPRRPRPARPTSPSWSPRSARSLRSCGPTR